MTSSTPRLRLLLIAPTCDGEDVGEAWLAFQWVRRLGRYHDVTLLTYHKRGRRPAAEQLKGVRVVEWTEPPLWGRAERFNSMFKVGYVAFYQRARRWIRRALAAGERFDLCHQLTPVALRYPSPAAGLPLPLVVGPVGGSLDSPPAFLAAEGSAPWFTRLRALDKARLRLDPLLRRTFSSAVCVLGIAPYVGELLASIPLRRFEVFSDTGVEAVPAPEREPRPAGPLSLLHVGRLVRTKGARDAIRAMDALRDLDLVLNVVGEGPDRAACEALVAELGLQERVVLHGRVPRIEVEEFYRRADVFVFPSYREAGGTVVWEAMAHGLPLVLADRGGPASSADRSCAFLASVTTPEELAVDVASAVRALVEDADLRARMGEASRRRVLAVGTWDARVERMNQVYEELVQSSV